MTATTPTIPTFEATNVQAAAAPQSHWREAWRRIRRSKLSMVCLAIVVAYVVLALLTYLPVFERQTPTGASAGKIWEVVGPSYQPPHSGTPAVWFGTDLFGRSVFWRSLYGARVALELTVGAGVLMVVIGLVLGIISGYFGGRIDDLIVWLFSTVSSVPWILMVIALVYVLDGYPRLKEHLGGVTPVIIALGLTDWVGLCRLVRGEVIKLRDLDFVSAARATGVGNMRILFKHVLPNVVHIVIITFSLAAVGYVQAEVILAFLGLGITDKPSWGRMIDDARVELLRGVWWQLAAATAAIFVLCLALNVLGDSLRDALDPKLRGVD